MKTLIKPTKKEYTIMINGIRKGHIDLNNDELIQLKQLGYKLHEYLPFVLYIWIKH
jgi:hypothetical protein